MKTKYIIVDKNTGERLKDLEDKTLKMFDTHKEAEIFCEENGVDYDYFKITEMII